MRYSGHHSFPHDRLPPAFGSKHLRRRVGRRDVQRPEHVLEHDVDDGLEPRPEVVRHDVQRHLPFHDLVQAHVLRHVRPLGVAEALGDDVRVALPLGGERLDVMLHAEEDGHALVVRRRVRRAHAQRAPVHLEPRARTGVEDVAAREHARAVRAAERLVAAHALERIPGRRALCDLFLREDVRLEVGLRRRRACCRGGRRMDGGRRRGRAVRRENHGAVAHGRRRRGGRRRLGAPLERHRGHALHLSGAPQRPRVDRLDVRREGREEAHRVQARRVVDGRAPQRFVAELRDLAQLRRREQPEAPLQLLQIEQPVAGVVHPRQRAVQPALDDGVLQAFVQRAHDLRGGHAGHVERQGEGQLPKPQRTAPHRVAEPRSANGLRRGDGGARHGALSEALTDRLGEDATRPEVRVTLHVVPHGDAHDRARGNAQGLHGREGEHRGVEDGGEHVAAEAGVCIEARAAAYARRRAERLGQHGARGDVGGHRGERDVATERRGYKLRDAKHRRALEGDDGALGDDGVEPVQ
mmetsp:Transcript_48623/g.150129  ORF Transcript_48623/g.150129 Transcript_48623/m.150129 type:complete len:524 (-) Transcript_48623:326-1897(-)